MMDVMGIRLLCQLTPKLQVRLCKQGRFDLKIRFLLFYIRAVMYL